MISSEVLGHLICLCAGLQLIGGSVCAILWLFFHDTWVQLTDILYKVTDWLKIYFWCTMGWNLHYYAPRESDAGVANYSPLLHAKVLLYRQLRTFGIIVAHLGLLCVLYGHFDVPAGTYARVVVAQPSKRTCGPILQPVKDQLLDVAGLLNVSTREKVRAVSAENTCNLKNLACEGRVDHANASYHKLRLLLDNTNVSLRSAVTAENTCILKNLACEGRVGHANASYHKLRLLLDTTNESLRTAVTLRHMESRAWRSKYNALRERRVVLSRGPQVVNTSDQCTAPPPPAIIQPVKTQPFMQVLKATQQCSATLASQCGILSATCTQKIVTYKAAFEQLYSLGHSRAEEAFDLFVERLTSRGHSLWSSQMLCLSVITLCFGLPSLCVCYRLMRYGPWSVLRTFVYYVFLKPIVYVLRLKRYVLKPYFWIRNGRTIIEESRKITAFSDIKVDDADPVEGRIWLRVHKRAPLVPVVVGQNGEYVTDIPRLKPTDPEPGPVTGFKTSSPGESIVNKDAGIICDFPPKRIQIMYTNGDPFAFGTCFDVAHDGTLPAAVTQHGTETLTEVLIRGPHPEHRLKFPMSRFKWAPRMDGRGWLRNKDECTMYDLGFICFTPDERSYLGLTGFTERQICYEPEDRIGKLSYFSPTRNAFVTYSGSLPGSGTWGPLTGVGYMAVNSEPGASGAAGTVVEKEEKVFGINAGQGSNVYYKYKDRGNMFISATTILSCMEALGIRVSRTSLQIDRWFQQLAGYTVEEPVLPAGPVQNDKIDKHLGDSPPGEAAKKKKQPGAPSDRYSHGNDAKVPFWQELELNVEAYRDLYHEDCRREEIERYGDYIEDEDLLKDDRRADDTIENEQEDRDQEKDACDDQLQSWMNDGEVTATAATGRRKRRAAAGEPAGEALRVAELLKVPITVSDLLKRFHSSPDDDKPTEGFQRDKCLAGAHPLVGPPPVTPSNVAPSTAAAVAAAVKAELAKDAAVELQKLRDQRQKMAVQHQRLYEATQAAASAAAAAAAPASVPAPAAVPETAAQIPQSAPVAAGPPVALAPAGVAPGLAPLPAQPLTPEVCVTAGESAPLPTPPTATVLDPKAANKARKNRKKKEQSRKAHRVQECTGCIFEPVSPTPAREYLKGLPIIMPIPGAEHPIAGSVAGAQGKYGVWNLPKRTVKQVCKVVQKDGTSGFEQTFYLPVTKQLRQDLPTWDDIKHTYRNLFIMLKAEGHRRVISPAVECGKNKQNTEHMIALLNELCAEFGITWFWFSGPATPGLLERINIGSAGLSFTVGGVNSSRTDVMGLGYLLGSTSTENPSESRTLLEQEEDRKKYQPTYAKQFDEITAELEKVHEDILRYEALVEENGRVNRTLNGGEPPTEPFRYIPNPIATLDEEIPEELKNLSKRAAGENLPKAPFVLLPPHLAKVTKDKLLDAARIEQGRRIALRKLLSDVKTNNRNRAMRTVDKAGWLKRPGESVEVDGTTMSIDDAILEWKVKLAQGEGDDAVKEIWRYCAQFPDVHTRLKSILESPKLDEFKEYKANVCPKFYAEGEKPDAEVMPDRYGDPYFREVGHYPDPKPKPKSKEGHNGPENDFQADLRGLAEKHVVKGKYVLPPQGVEAQKSSMRAQALLAAAKDAPLNYEEECDLVTAAEYTGEIYNNSLLGYATELPHKLNSKYTPPPSGGWASRPSEEHPHNPVTGMSKEYHSTPLEPSFAEGHENSGSYVGKAETLLEKGTDGLKEALSGLHDKSAGASNRYRPGWTKKQWAKEDPVQVVDFALTRIILTAAAAYDEGITGLRAKELCEYGISDPKELHVKNEVHSPGKIKEGRYRLIWGCSLIDIVVQILLHKSDNSAHIEAYQLGHMIHAALGLGHHDEGIQTLVEAARAQGLDRNVVTSDAAAYDFSVPGRLIWADARRRSRAIDGRKPYLAALLLMFAHVLCCHLVTAGDTVYECLKYGVTCSGMISTGSQNTFIRLVLAFFAGAEAAIAIGDDMITDPGFKPVKLLRLNIRSRDVVRSPGPKIDFTSHIIDCNSATAEYGNVEKMLWHQFEVSSDDYSKVATDEDGVESRTWEGELERLTSIMFVLRNTPSIRDAFFEACCKHGKLSQNSSAAAFAVSAEARAAADSFALSQEQ